MKPGIPWSVKGIEPEVREAAKHAARKAGMTLGEWLNTVILDQSDDPQPENPPSAAIPQKEFFGDEPEHEAIGSGEGTIRLEDIAQQLSHLAQRERDSASIMPYEPPRARDHDRDTLTRILSRIDSNERQAVEAFTAVNQRLSVLGRQIATSAKPKSFDKPEDVPGFTALEGAIRNVVEHIETSEKRTRESLKSMQDRLGDMAERASHTNTDDLVRAAPAFASLEARIADMASRMQRSENMLQAGLPDLVRKEIDQLAERIETVKQSAETLASEAQSNAVGVAKGELRDIEARILGVLKEAQATIGSQSVASSELRELRAEIGGLNTRIEDVKSGSANAGDVKALRVAVEQLSTRVAQGPDMRPLADMDKRLGDLTHKLDQNHAAVRNLPQFGELEKRIAELDHRLGEAVRLQGDGQAVTALEQQIAAVHERVGKTEVQLGHLETMERAISQLYDSLEQNRTHASQTAEDAANRAVERVLANQQAAGPSPELRAMEEGLRAVRESAAGAEQRNQDTLEAVHETLEQIVNKLTELETAAAGHQLAANMAQGSVDEAKAFTGAQAWENAGDQFADAPAPEAEQSQFYDPAGVFEDQADALPDSVEDADEMPDASLLAEPADMPQEPVFGEQGEHVEGPADMVADPAAGLSGGDDFISAARRAAQAAASRPNVLHPDVKPDLKAGANTRRLGFSLPFMKGKKKMQPMSFKDGKPVEEVSPAKSNANKRKKLVLAGIVLLAAVSAFAFNMLAKQSKPAKQTMSIETPAQIAPAKTLMAPATPGNPGLPSPTAMEGQKQADLNAIAAVDPLATGSLPVKKTDATLASIVAEPGNVTRPAEMPPAEVGTLALRQAASQGDAKAQFIIASRYLDGQSVGQDIPKAAKWYQQAASRGLAPAQYRLATLFERGKGVPQDAATALLWYERAAEGGNIKAMHNAAVIAAGNQAGTPNYDKAFKWFKAAAEFGLHDSQFNLAVLYERGLGTKVDQPEAYFWYMLAAEQGDADAGKRAAAMAKTMDGDMVATATARVKSWAPAPSVADANVVAITDPVWNTSDASQDTMAKPVATEMAGNPVAEAQLLLSKLGFNVGTPDGKMGNRTANAVRLFQLQSGMKVTGEITPDLIEAMRSKSG